jgi:hypothetical protein
LGQEHVRLLLCEYNVSYSTESIIFLSFLGFEYRALFIFFRPGYLTDSGLYARAVAMANNLKSSTLYSTVVVITYGDLPPNSTYMAPLASQRHSTGKHGVSFIYFCVLSLCRFVLRAHSKKQIEPIVDTGRKYSS